MNSVKVSPVCINDQKPGLSGPVIWKKCSPLPIGPGLSSQKYIINGIYLIFFELLPKRQPVFTGNLKQAFDAQMRFFSMALLVVLEVISGCSGSGGGDTSRSRNSRGTSSQVTRGATDQLPANQGPKVAQIGDEEIDIPQDPQELASQVQQREAQYQAEQAELKRLNLVNEALCQKLSDVKSSCPGKKPITSDAWVEQLSCEGNYEKVQVNTKVEVSINSTSGGTFRVKINDTYESGLLSPGTTELKAGHRQDNTVNERRRGPVRPDFVRSPLLQVEIPEFLN